MIPEELKLIVANFSSEEQEMVVSAYELAKSTLKDKVRGNNHPFIEHPLGVATIINGLWPNASAVTAVFLHEANRFQADNVTDLNKTALLNSFRGKYPDSIIDIVISLNKISFIKLQETNLDEERYRKLIISYSSDPQQVVLIKLADRLEVMRNLSILPPLKQQAKIMETILLYVPLAHQLGLYWLQKELEDLFLKYSEPEDYRAITNYLKATERDREKLVSKFILPLKEKLDNIGIKYEFKIRTKSAFSIWKKMKAQNVSFEGIFDVFAIRFIIDSPPDRETEHKLCWEVFSLVNSVYTSDTKRLRDWLSFPKENGYESLHTTVTTDEGRTVEVQIRTRRMDYIAEMGHASHSSYKGIKSEEWLNNYLNGVRERMKHSDSTKYEQVSPLVLNEIFIFTPTGDLIQLPMGATVLDFAFGIHSNLGVKCSGALVNGKMVPIKEKLATGDVVDIISNKNQKPTADWLNFVVTSKARNKIKQKLKEEEFKRAAVGKELLDRRLKNWKLELNDDDLAILVKKYKFKTINEFYGAIGSEAINAIEIKDYLSKKNETDSGQEFEKYEKESPESQSGSDYLIIGGKLSNVEYKMAKCCNPIYGDEVFGFVTIKDGIKIHRMSCPNAARLIENYPYRIQKVKWKESVGKGSFQVSMKVLVDGDMSVMNSVISTVNGFKSSIRSINAAESIRGSYEINMQLYVPGNGELDKIIATLKRIKEIRQVTRL